MALYETFFATCPATIYFCFLAIFVQLAIFEPIPISTSWSCATQTISETKILISLLISKINLTIVLNFRNQIRVHKKSAKSCNLSFHNQINSVTQSFGFRFSVVVNFFFDRQYIQITICSFTLEVIN